MRIVRQFLVQGTRELGELFMPGLGARGTFATGLGALGAMLFLVVAGVEVPREAVRGSVGLVALELGMPSVMARGANKGSLRSLATSRTRPGRTSPLFLGTVVSLHCLHLVTLE